jgi:hypothetical protein
MPFGPTETAARSVAATPVVVARNARDRTATPRDLKDAWLFAEAGADLALRAWFRSPRAGRAAARALYDGALAREERAARALATSVGADCA